MRKDDFSKCTNTQQPYIVTDDDLYLLDKLKNICNKGFSAEVKSDKKGCFKVYEVRKSAV